MAKGREHLKGLFMAIKLSGNWKNGLALDLHTTKSEYAGVDQYGHDRFNNTRSEIGELVYLLKYKNDIEAVNKIVGKIKESINGIDKFDFIIPIPPSNKSRNKQPVLLVAKALSDEFNVPILIDALDKKSGASEIKNVQDANERLKLLEGVMVLNPSYNIEGKEILLIDDLYRSGITLSVATTLLYKQGRAKTVCVLTLTKTRSNR
jgi:competence protein ComFC